MELPSNGQSNGLFTPQMPQNQTYQVEEVEQDDGSTGIQNNDQQEYINYLYQDFQYLMNEINKQPFILPNYDTYKQFILQYGYMLNEKGFNVPILYYGDPNQLTMESILNAPIVVDELYNHETFIENNCDNLAIKEDINNYIRGIMLFNEQMWIQQQCVQYDSNQVPTDGGQENTRMDKQNGQDDINQITVENGRLNGQESVGKPRVFETEGGTVPESIITAPISGLEVIPIQTESVRNMGMIELPTISSTGGKRPRGKSAKGPRISKSPKVIRLPNMNKSKEKAPKKNAKRTSTNWDTTDERFLNQIRDGLAASERVVEEKKNDEIRTCQAERREHLGIVVSDESEDLESKSTQLPDSFKRTTQQFLNPTNVYTESMNRAQVILNKRTDSQKNKFWILKENLKAPDDEFPRNYISINWSFSGRHVVHDMNTTLFKGLNHFYRTLNETEFNTVVISKCRLYSNSMEFFNVLLPVKCFRLSENWIDNVSGSESFNVLLSVLRLIKGFRRKFDIQCIVSYYCRGTPKNLNIHIRQIEGVNILVGEQILDGKKYPFFMTTEEIVFKRDGNKQPIEPVKQTFVITNMITPEDITLSGFPKLKGGLHKDVYIKEGKPDVVGEKGVEYADIFTTTLVRWQKPKTFGFACAVKCDEPILNLPPNETQIAQLYSLPVVHLEDDIYPPKDRKSFDFMFKIIFPYSYYTKERDWLGRELVIENVIDHVDNGVCPFILKDEYDKILKIIYSYCGEEDRLDDLTDTRIQPSSQHMNECTDQTRIIKAIERKKEEIKERNRFEGLPPPIIGNGILNQQPNGYGKFDDSINLHLEHHTVDTKPKFISVDEILRQPNQPTQNQFIQPFTQVFGINQHSDQQSNQPFGQQSNQCSSFDLNSFGFTH